MLVLSMNKALPSLSTVTSKNIIESGIQFTIILKIEFNLVMYFPFSVSFRLVTLDMNLIKIIVQIFSSKNFCNSNKLIIIVMTVEKWFFSEYHWSQHTSKWPHVKWIVIKLNDSSLWAIIMTHYLWEWLYVLPDNQQEVQVPWSI